MTYFIGLDLGQSQDYTALCVVEMTTGPTREMEYQVRHLQRFPLGTAYPVIVREVVKMTGVLHGAQLVVDHTGVGRAIVDLFKDAGLRPVAVTITGGDLATHEGEVWRVPKRDLVGVLAVAFQTNRLKIAADLPEAQTLINELLNFKVKISLKTAHDSYESWREGVHDDLVLAVAMAVWIAHERGQITVGSPTPRGGRSRPQIPIMDRFFGGKIPHL